MYYHKRNICIHSTANAVKKASRFGKSSLDDFVLGVDDTSKYVFPTIDEIPPAYYLARVMAVEPSTTGRGEPAVDVCYAFTADYTDFYFVRQRYAKGGIHYKKLIAALCKAGAPAGKSIAAAVGTLEIVSFGYPTSSEIGSIIQRKPYQLKEGETLESVAELFDEYASG